MGVTTGTDNRLETDGTYDYQYDPEGNSVRRTAADQSYTVYTWDHRNRLIAVTDFDDSDTELTRVEYHYDAFDQLVGRKVFLNASSTADESQVFVYENGQVVLQFDGSGNDDLLAEDLSHRYLWGPMVDQVLAEETVNNLTDAGLNEVLWPLTDHLGTVRDRVDSSGTVVEHAEYDAFGRRLDTPAVDAVFGWTGRYRDPLTGLQYNTARWYNPDLGRWMSQDPIGFAAGDANLNRYVGNQSTMLVDPNGLQERRWTGGAIDDRPYFGQIEDGEFLEGIQVFLFSGLRTGFGLWGNYDTAHKQEVQVILRNRRIKAGEIKPDYVGGCDPVVGLITGKGRGNFKIPKKISLPLLLRSASKKAATSEVNPRLTLRLSAFYRYRNAGGAKNLSQWVKSTQGNAKYGTGFKSGFAKWIRSIENPHGNSVLSQRPATLYKLEDNCGNLLKWGVSQDPSKRYPASFMYKKNIFPIQTGPRSQILRIERDYIERMPGPLNREPWRGLKLIEESK